MAAITFGARGFLEYNSEHRLLICRECRYAVQKSAIESHLLRHKIYRRDRQRLLSSISRLDLLEPHEVSLPSPGSTPVSGIPVLSGFRCAVAACRHLTVTAKRMKRHWNEAHGAGEHASLSSSFACPVKLQTFFRGTKVRYFEVSSPMEPLNDDDGDDSNHNNDDNGHNNEDDHSEREEERHNNGAARPLQLPQTVAARPVTVAKSPPTDDVQELLTYLHHFITVTSLTLPAAGDQQFPQKYWQTDVIKQALRERWLMSGLMAISTQHLVALADDPTSEEIYCERHAQYASSFVAGLGSITSCDPCIDIDKAVEDMKKTSELIRCLLRCAQGPLAELALSYDSMALFQLISIVSKIQGCIVPESTVRPGGSRNDFSEQDQSTTGDSTPGFSGGGIPSVVIDRLHALPTLITERLGRPENAGGVLAVLSAINAMIECCDISFAHDEAKAGWKGVAMWLTKVGDHFNGMVSRRHPAALVVFAHWAAILVRRAENVGCWYLNRWAEVIVLQVTRHVLLHDREVLDLVEDLVNKVNDQS